MPNPNSQRRVVITGVGVVCPLGWTASTIRRELLADRHALALHEIGLEQPIWFGAVNAEFFRDNPLLESLDPREREIATCDPGFLYGMWAAHRALADAGLTRESGESLSVDPARLASTVSSSKGFLRALLQAHRLFLGATGEQAVGGVTLADVFGCFRADSLGHWLARHFGFTGPVLNTAAACATGLHSVILGAELIRDGVADVVLAGSAECTRNPLPLAGFYNMGALSSELCRPFHRDRSGFNAGEGAAVFVLESSEHAVARRARVLGILSGWDYRSEAYHVTAIEPGAGTAETAVRRTLAKAGWRAHEVDYINAHGTGTPLNDKAESEMIERIFGNPTPWVSSLKGHVGHLLGASASVELALTLIALDQGYIPPTARLDCPDPAFRVRFVPPGGLKQHIQRFLKFSLGFGGHVAIVAIERPASG